MSTVRFEPAKNKSVFLTGYDYWTTRSYDNSYAYGGSVSSGYMFVREKKKDFEPVFLILNLK